jgi:NAD(P)-dependent dehydrogenase (short-subunit alcohol dehydrogenase family)
MNDNVVVITGVRGLGLACARRLGVGKQLVLADNNPEVLADTVRQFEDDGYKVLSAVVNVADPNSVNELTALVARTGRLATLMHTAGVSPGMADWETIFNVNLVGTIHILNAFKPLAVDGTVAFVTASNAAYYSPVPLDVEEKLALAPIEDLKAVVQSVAGHDTGIGSYWLAKRSNQLRVQAQAAEWGARGARLLSISPGIISTAMIRHERKHGAPIDQTIASQPIARLGNAEDIASAVCWLAGPEASYITGTDLLVDGGMQASLRWSKLSTEYLESFKKDTTS